MIVNSSLPLIPKIVAQTFFWDGCPHKWDKRRGKLRITRNIYSLTRWQFSIIIMLGIYIIYLLYRSAHSWLTGRPIMEYCLCVHLLCATLIVFTMHVLTFKRTVEMAALINSALRYQRWFISRYVDPYNRESVMEAKAGPIENVPKTFYRYIHVFTGTLLIIYIKNPYNYIFVSSILPPEAKNLMSLIIVGFLILYNVYVALSLISFFGMIFIYPLLIIRETEAQIYLHSKFHYWTTPKLRTTEHLIHNYRILSYLIRSCDNIFSDFLMPFISIVTRAGIFDIYMLIQYVTKMTLLLCLMSMTSFLAIFLTGFSMLFFSASVNNVSVKVRSSWYSYYALQSKFYIKKRDVKLWTTFRRSCKNFGVQVGKIYMIKSHTTLTISDLLISEVASLLLATSNDGKSINNV